jgi:hypothetical protein
MAEGKCKNWRELCDAALEAKDVSGADLQLDPFEVLSEIADLHVAMRPVHHRWMASPPLDSISKSENSRANTLFSYAAKSGWIDTPVVVPGSLRCLRG